MIAQETIERIKERASLLEIVSEYTQVKRSGSRFFAVCPFHSEKTPSFQVREEDGSYRCFGCGASGNIFSFLMTIRGITFPEAVEELASRYSIEIKREGGSGARTGGGDSTFKKGLFNANRIALEYFKGSLQKAPSQVAKYIEERGITRESIENFAIGYAPGRGGLHAVLSKLKISDDVGVAAGLLRRKDSGEVMDTFRERIIFPIWFDSKRVSGFGGRTIPALVAEGSHPPKYLNSPETPIYNKSKLLFGMPQALKSCRENKSAFVVEGYMDVVGLSQAGVQNVLATCGTALTKDHVEKLSRLVKKVIILFDGDVAGRTAAAKSFLSFMNAPIEVYATFLPDGDDPDSIARAQGHDTAKYLEALQKRSLLECYIDHLIANEGGASPSDLGSIGTGNVAKEISKVLSQVKDPIVRDQYIQNASFKLKVRGELLSGAASSQQVQADKGGDVPSLRPEPESRLNEALESLSRADKEILATIMVHKESLPQKALSDPELVELLHPAVLGFISELFSIMKEEENQKDRIRELLHLCGPSWVKHWKEAYKISETPGVDLIGHFEECRRTLRKAKLQEHAKIISARLQASVGEEEKLVLVQERIGIERRLREEGAS